jgi:hypothetical protein
MMSRVILEKKPWVVLLYFFICLVRIEYLISNVLICFFLEIPYLVGSTTCFSSQEHKG